MPTAWFNVLPVMPEPLQPPLHPATREPVGPDDLAPLFPMGLIAQEVSTDQWIDIPGEVLDILRLWRPTPLVRAERLEAALGTPARIYYKDESISPAGSHKPNTAVAQAFYNKAEGVRRLATETGAGQWGSALAFACTQFGLDCKVYMVRASYDQKPYRKILMETWGSEVVPSPVDQPDHPGSLGLAISDAVRDAVRSRRHPLLARVGAQPRVAAPDRDRAGGEGAAGAGRRRAARRRHRLLRRRVEPERHRAAVRPRRGRAARRRRSRRRARRSPRARSTTTSATPPGMTPLMAMYTLGHEFVPPPIHAGGLRYHGDAPIISSLVRSGRMEAVAYPQGKTFEAAIQFANAEGKLPAPETGHAIRAVIDEALAAKETGEERVILFNFSGHGLLDLSAYDDYLHGRLIDA